MYDASKGGYKPFGAIGQGLKNNTSVAFDTDPGDRFMLFTITPEQAGYTMGTRTFEFEVGSYPFSNRKLGVPNQPPDIALEAQEAAAAAEAAVGAMGSASLLQVTGGLTSVVVVTWSLF